MGGGVGVTLCNHIFYLFFSLNEMRVAAPCTRSTLAKRLTALKADTPFASAPRCGSGLTRFLFVDAGQEKNNVVTLMPTRISPVLDFL